MRYKDAIIQNVPTAVKKILKENMRIAVKEGDDGKMRETGGVYFEKGLMVKGIVGSGKTYLLHAIKNHYQTWMKCTQVHNWVSLLFEMKSENFSRVNSTVNTILEADVIFLDDIGAEKASEWSNEILYMIINEAYNKRKKLFINTNLSDAEFQKEYGDRITSRLGEMCILVKMPDRDWRQ